jgi:hypothetical protein
MWLYWNVTLMSIGTSSLRTIGIILLKKHNFNGKEETGLKPRRMTPHFWRLEYNTNRQDTQFFYVSYMQCFEFLF